MKRILLAFIICGALLVACSKDDNIHSEQTLVVTFSLAASEDSTRAYGNGEVVNDLRYAIYAQGDYTRPLITNIKKGAFAGDATSTTISEELIRGNKYTALFWADYDAGDTNNNNAGAHARYTIDWGTNTVTMNTADLVAQDETLDAFFARVDFTAASRVEVDLKRPFAQLNITANDYSYATNNNIEVTKTALQIVAYTQLNLWSGEVVGQSETINFAENIIPTATIGAQDKHLSMNYILVGNSEYTAAPTLTAYGTRDGGAEQQLFTATYDDVMLKRNRRTNIVGKIITSNLAGQNNGQNTNNN